LKGKGQTKNGGWRSREHSRWGGRSIKMKKERPFLEEGKLPFPSLNGGNEEKGKENRMTKEGRRQRSVQPATRFSPGALRKKKHR